MSDYDVKKIEKNSKSSRTDYFRNATKHKKKNKKQKNKKEKSFWDVPQQYTTDDNSDLNYNYLDLEKKLEIEIDKWGVDSISSQILNLIKNDYQQYKDEWSDQPEELLINLFYPHAKKALKTGYDKAQNILPSLPKDIEKLTIATYSKSIEKLQSHFEQNKNKTEKNITQSTIKEPQTKKLIEKIINIFIEQGIYLEEQKVHHPIINVRR
jgi:dGTP triphosphohydrolase